MSTASAKILVSSADCSAWIQISGRANFASSVDFKTLVNGLHEEGCRRFALDLTSCVLMDSTFLGVLAGFGLMKNPGGASDKCDIELASPNARVSELLENLGVLPLFKVTVGPLQLPGDVEACTPELGSHTQKEITQTSLEAHQTLMAAHPDNVARFKDVAQFLAEDLKNLEKAS